MSEDLRAAEECAREPIHIPSAIQPHGVMLIAERTSQEITHAAGDVAGVLGCPAWIGRTLGEVLGDQLAGRVEHVTHSGAVGGFAGHLNGRPGAGYDVSAHVAGPHLVVEIEPGFAEALPASSLMGLLEAAGAAFERAPDLMALYDRAAIEFQRLTGFDRVMIYRFGDDGAGAVLAEATTGGMPSFLNHHFPGSDIPAQARALYVRNLVRVIPDVSYEPAPLSPAWESSEPLDMSDCALRSVSPVHMQYLRNMGVGASASISIVKDGLLWGLIACHHRTPKLMAFDIRSASRALAGGLARQVRAKEERATYHERLRLRSLEDAVAARLAGAGGLEADLAAGIGRVQTIMASDGAAVVRGGDVGSSGVCPPVQQIRALAELVARSGPAPVATEKLGDLYAPAAGFADQAAGLLGVVLDADEPFVLLWFRAEAVEHVNWAGNPHKSVSLKPGEALTPRSSFEAWSEIVRGRSDPWSVAEIESAERFRDVLLEARAHRRLQALNLQLTEAVREKDELLQQKEMLLKEVNHRIQNSLQIVSSFLGLQSRDVHDPRLNAAFEEARRRLSAVALVHRRLYRADQIEAVDLSRYIEELLEDMAASLGDEWAGMITATTQPVVTPTDRAVTIGLVLTELVINANKYAYAGAPGRIEVTLEEDGPDLRVIVADRGVGRGSPGEGFGSRMIRAMVSQLSGRLEYFDNAPGARAVLTAPIAPPRVTPTG